MSSTERAGGPRDGLIVGSILLLGLVLRLFRLDFQSFWFDEILSVLASSGTLANVIFDPIANTRVPPLYYVVTHFLLGFDNQELWLRLPSVLFGVASIGLVYALARSWFDYKVGRIAALLMAISPFHVWYSQEARPYSLLLFLTLVSVWFLARLLDRPEDVGLRAGFVLSATATVYCHTVAAAFLVFLFAAVLLSRDWRSHWTRWLVNFAAIGLLLLPAAWLLSTYDVAPAAPAKAVPWIAVTLAPYLVWAFGTGYSLGPSLTELHLPDRLEIVLGQAWFVVPILALLGLGLLYGAWEILRRQRERATLTLAWLVLPVGLAVIAGALPGETFNVRYALAAFPPFVIILAAGLRHVSKGTMRNLAVVLLLAVDLVALSNYYFDRHYQREDNRAAGEFLASHVAPDDLVLSSAGYVRLALEHYSHSPGVTFVEIDGNGAEAEREILSAAGRHERLWLFRSRSYHGDPEGTIPGFLDRVGDRDLEFRSNGVELVRYRLNGRYSSTSM